MSDPSIDPNSDENPTDHFNTVLYTGDGQTTKNVTVGFGRFYMDKRSNYWSSQFNRFC